MGIVLNIVVTRSVWTNERTNLADGQPENNVLADTVGFKGIKIIPSLSF